MTAAQLITRLTELDTSCISDVSPDLRILHHRIKPLNPDIKLAGTAFTVYSEGDLIPVLMGLEQASAGDVLVIDACGAEDALFGELVCTDALRKGLKGIVTDGFCRDVEGIRASGLPVYASSSCPRVAGKIKTGQFQVELQIGGITMRPGDIIFGDQDGLVVLAPEDAEDIISKAEKVQEMEEQVMKKVKGGTPFNDLLNTREHYYNLEKGVPTEFRFKF
jgi:regulator of RNase E activity RraA